MCPFPDMKRVLELQLWWRCCAGRRLLNEHELAAHLNAAFPTATATVLELHLLSPFEQLQVGRNADVMITLQGSLAFRLVCNCNRTLTCFHVKHVCMPILWWISQTQSNCRCLNFWHYQRSPAELSSTKYYISIKTKGMSSKPWKLVRTKIRVARPGQVFETLAHNTYTCSTSTKPQKFPRQSWQEKMQS